MTTHEEWRSAVGFEGLYIVSDLGRVRRIYPKKAGRDPDDPTGILRMPPQTHGYLRVSIFVEGKQLTRTVHRLVADAFLGPRPTPQAPDQPQERKQGRQPPRESGVGHSERESTARIQNAWAPRHQGRRKRQRQTQQPEGSRDATSSRDRRILQRSGSCVWGVSESVGYKAIMGKTWTEVPRLPLA